VTLVAAAVAGGPLLWHPRPLLVWNACASSAVGFYALTPVRDLGRGDMVVAWPPLSARRLAADRGYLPAGVPLVKPVAAVAGDLVCGERARIFINGRLVAMRRSIDPRGRVMPWWRGCRRLRPGEALLLSAHAAQAFDGRYFGVSRSADLLGRAKLLWIAGAKG
jgi:conjugative transfer signal peptidase TraF